MATAGTPPKLATTTSDGSNDAATLPLYRNEPGAKRVDMATLLRQRSQGDRISTESVAVSPRKLPERRLQSCIEAVKIRSAFM